jgi:pyruvate kinase
MARRTKIVATIGPASERPELLVALIEAGVDVIRLNLSHGSVEGHTQRVSDVRAAAERAGRPVAILADLPGPKVRCGPFPEGGSELVVGDATELAVGSSASDEHRIEVDYATMLDDLRAGDHVVLGDGAIRLRVTSVGAESASALVVAGGSAQGRPGAHLPSERLRLTAPTDEDLRLAMELARAGVDFIAVSFVRQAKDMARVRAVVSDWPVRLVAKIETGPAVDDLENIAAISDAVMVARGDLGIECPLEDVPHLQKQIVRYCVEAGVPVITATQMLESMITAPAPTRAEVSDVANAVFDGTDAVMLSGETAIGVDPINVVRTMVRIARRAESRASYRQWGARLGRVQRSVLAHASDTERITMAVTHAAYQAAADMGAVAILCCTRTGRTARAMAKFRPDAKLLGLSPNESTVRALALSWGVVPLHVDTYRSTDELVWFAVERSVGAGHVKIGDVVIVLAGAPERPTGAATDVLRVVRVA